MAVAKLFGAVGHFQDQFFHGDAGAVAPITAEDEADADDVIGIVAGADLEAAGAGDDVDAGLEAAIVGEGDGDRGLEIDRSGPGFFGEAIEG